MTDLLKLDGVPIFDRVTIKYTCLFGVRQHTGFSWLAQLITEIRKHQLRFLCLNNEAIIYIPHHIINYMKGGFNQFALDRGDAEMVFGGAIIIPRDEPDISVVIPMIREEDEKANQENIYRAKVLIEEIDEEQAPISKTSFFDVNLTNKIKKIKQHFYKK
jgi:hypothetical protein